jgi:hypothetical protein
MDARARELMLLEHNFWQSMVDGDTDAAVSMLDEPALLVSTHGAIQFDRDGYRQMAEQSSVVIKSFELDDIKVVFPTDDTAVLTYSVRQTLAPRSEPGEVVQDMTDTSVWTHKHGQWLCVLHTESPVDRSMRAPKASGTD